MTVRTLVLLRHAKAGHPHGIGDSERPLTPRGHADAGAAGAWLAKHGLRPDLVLCSPARRTRETWHGVRVAIGTDPDVRFERRLYDSGASDVLELVAGTATDIETVVVIGHNPTLSMVSMSLDPDAGDSEGLRTAGIAVHTFRGAWRDLAAAPLTASHTARA